MTGRRRRRRRGRGRERRRRRRERTRGKGRRGRGRRRRERRGRVEEGEDAYLTSSLRDFKQILTLVTIKYLTNFSELNVKMLLRFYI
jgi:hypothetical protein